MLVFNLFMTSPDRKNGTVYHTVLRHPSTNVAYLEKKWVSWYNSLVSFLSENETYIVEYFIGILRCGLKKPQDTFLWVHSKHVIF